MFKKILFSLVFLLPLVTTAESPEILEDLEIMAVINSPDEVKLGEKIELDASNSLVANGTGASFTWQLGDFSEEGEGIEKTFSSLGKNKVVLSVNQGKSKSSTQKEILVYDKKVAVIANKEKEFRGLKNYANENGNFVKFFEISSDFNLEKSLQEAFLKERDFLDGVETVIFDEADYQTVQAVVGFFSFKDKDKEEKKLFVKISDSSLKIEGNVLGKILKGKNLDFLLTRPEALNPIFKEKDFGKIKTLLEARSVEYSDIFDKKENFSFLLLSKLIEKLSLEGVRIDVIFMILALPFVALFVVFFRQVIGLSTFGVYIPTITALSFLILGLEVGLMVIIFILISSYFIRILVDKIEIPFIPKASLMLSSVSLSFFFLIGVSILLDLQIPLELTIFPMLVISTIAEKFIGAQYSEGVGGALLLTLQTILIAVISFLLVKVNFIENLILGLPEIVILALIGNIVIGKFTGLRLTEYFKFKSMLKDGIEE